MIPAPLFHSIKEICPELLEQYIHAQNEKYPRGPSRGTNGQKRNKSPNHPEATMQKDMHKKGKQEMP